MRLWWFLSPGLYSLAALDELNIFKEHPVLRIRRRPNPFAILFEAYRKVIYGSAKPLPPGLPDFAVAGRAAHREPHPAGRSRRSSSSDSSPTSRR